MADPRGSGDWATERTLRELRDKVEKSNDLLGKLTNTRIKQADTFEGVMEEVNQDLGGLADALTDAQKAIEANEILEERRAARNRAKKDAQEQEDNKRRDKRRRKVEDYQRSFSDLSRNLMSGANTADGFGRILDRAGDRAVTAIAGLPWGIGTVLGITAAGFQAAIGYVITSLTITRETFVDLYQSGIRFDGSILEMRKSVTAAGLTISDFDRIAKTASQTISKFGEKRFLDSTTRLAKTFTEFGLTAAQGSEYFAEYLENSRLTGTLYFKTMEEQEKAFERNIKQQYEINRLTGVSVKAQRDAQRKLREESEYQLMMANVAPQMREAIEKIENKLSLFGTDFAKEAATLFGTGAVRPGGELATLGTFAPEIIAMLRRGPEAFDAEEMGKVMVRVTERLGPGMVAGLALKYPAMMNMLARGRQVGLSMTPPPEGAKTPAEKLDETTLATIKTMNAVDLAFKKLNSTLTDLAQKGLATFGPQLLSGAEGLEKFAQDPMGTLTAAPARIADYLGGIGSDTGPNWFGKLVQQFRQGDGLLGIATGFLKNLVMDNLITPLTTALKEKWEDLSTRLSAAWHELTEVLNTWLMSWKESLPSLRNILLGRDLPAPATAPPGTPSIRQPGFLPSLPFSGIMRPNVNVAPQIPTPPVVDREAEARSMMLAEYEREQTTGGRRTPDEAERRGLLGLLSQLLGATQRVERAIQNQ